MLLAVLDQTIVAIALSTVAGDLRPCRTCPGASQQPPSISDTDEELLRPLGLADPVHLDDDHAFAADVGQVDEH